MQNTKVMKLNTAALLTGAGLYLKKMKSNSINVLIDLKHSEDCLRYPSMNKDYIPKYKYTDKTANGLTRCIVDWLNLNAHQAERINSAGRVLDKTMVVKDVMGINRTIGTKCYIPGTGTNGTADISSVIKGRAVKIEVKMKDKQSLDQIKYQRDIESAGGQYWLIHDFEEFIFHYKNFIEYLFAQSK